MLDNLEINEEKNIVIVSVNPNIYPLDVIYSAAYIFTDQCYVIIDGDPKEEIFVQLKPKEKGDLIKIGNEFNNELICYSNYAVQCTRNAKLREAILKRVLLTNSVGKEPNQEEDFAEVRSISEVGSKEEQNSLDDPEGIAIPWEEKYGKDKDRPREK